MRIVDAVPSEFAEEATQAVSWFSERKKSAFKITGFDEDASTRLSEGESELHLILCGVLDGDEVCLREKFRVRRLPDELEVIHEPDPEPAFGSPAPELDPPAGERKGWLARVLPSAEFTVLLFYRGFW